MKAKLFLDSLIAVLVVSVIFLCLSYFDRNFLYVSAFVWVTLPILLILDYVKYKICKPLEK